MLRKTLSIIVIGVALIMFPVAPGGAQGIKDFVESVLQLLLVPANASVGPAIDLIQKSPEATRGSILLWLENDARDANRRGDQERLDRINAFLDGVKNGDWAAWEKIVSEVAPVFTDNWDLEVYAGSGTHFNLRQRYDVNLFDSTGDIIGVFTVEALKDDVITIGTVRRDDNVDCTYTGTIQENREQIIGRFTCTDGTEGAWEADIYRGMITDADRDVVVGGRGNDDLEEGEGNGGPTEIQIARAAALNLPSCDDRIRPFLEDGLAAGDQDQLVEGMGGCSEQGGALYSVCVCSVVPTGRSGYNCKGGHQAGGVAAAVRSRQEAQVAACQRSPDSVYYCSPLTVVVRSYSWGESLPPLAPCAQ